MRDGRHALRDECGDSQTSVRLRWGRQLVHRCGERVDEPLRPLPPARLHLQLERGEVRRLPDDCERLSRVRAHGRVRLSGLAPARLSGEPQGQHDRSVRAHGHHLPEEQHEDLR